MPQFPIIVPKVWGSEIWYVNEPEYCCKVLDINKFASGSLHYHSIKKETFIITRGKIQLEHGDKKEILRTGATITLEPQTPHRFTALKDSSILEISTHHDDNDVTRIEKSSDNKSHTLQN